MKDSDDLKVGDTLICISNDGYTTCGTNKTITGIKYNFINFNKNPTFPGVGWIKRDEVHWHCYRRFPFIPFETTESPSEAEAEPGLGGTHG